MLIAKSDFWQVWPLAFRVVIINCTNELATNHHAASCKRPNCEICAGGFQRAVQVPVSVNKIKAQINIYISIYLEIFTHILHFTYFWTLFCGWNSHLIYIYSNQCAKIQQSLIKKIRCALDIGRELKTKQIKAHQLCECVSCVFFLFLATDEENYVYMWSLEGHYFVAAHLNFSFNKENVNTIIIKDAFTRTILILIIYKLTSFMCNIYIIFL